MEFRQVAHSVARGARPSLLFSATKPDRSAFNLQQQRRHQSSEASAPAPPSPTITRSRPAPPQPRADSILQPRAPPAPVSRPSILSSPRGVGLSSLYPPRPQRFIDPSQNGPASKAGAIPPPPSPGNPWSIPSTIESDFANAAEMTGVARHGMVQWTESEFKEKYGFDKVDNVRLSPSLGRMVHVNGHVDPVKAIILCNKGTFANRLPGMVNSQRFHERPALKRKRKLREAWKRRFQKGFGATVLRAMELRKQGW